MSNMSLMMTIKECLSALLITSGNGREFVAINKEGVWLNLHVQEDRTVKVTMNLACNVEPRPRQDLYAVAQLMCIRNGFTDPCAVDEVYWELKFEGDMAWFYDWAEAIEMAEDRQNWLQDLLDEAFKA